MLDPRFKNLSLIFSFIGYGEGVNIVEEYTIFILYASKVLSSFASNDII
jgi:hypothetical protein